MFQTDTIVAIKDTLSNAQTAVKQIADSLHGDMNDLIGHASNAIDTLAKAADPISNSELVADSTLTLHFNGWPVMLWGDTITDPQSIGNLIDIHNQVLPYSLLRDDWIMGMLIGCFLLAILVVAFSFKYLKRQAQKVFIPSNNTEKANMVKSPSETYVPLAMALMHCTCGGMLLFYLINQRYDIQVGLSAPPSILALLIASVAVYDWFRWMLYNFINWIFFSKSDRRIWNSGFAFLLTLESILLFPITVATINLGWDIKTIAISNIVLYGLIRISMLYHSFRIFFPKTYGLLHLFAYLCTLELVPLISIWKIVELICSGLLVKY